MLRRTHYFIFIICFLSNVIGQEEEEEREPGDALADDLNTVTSHPFELIFFGILWCACCFGCFCHYSFAFMGGGANEAGGRIAADHGATRVALVAEGENGKEA